MEERNAHSSGPVSFNQCLIEVEVAAENGGRVPLPVMGGGARDALPEGGVSPRPMPASAPYKESVERTAGKLVPFFITLIPLLRFAGTRAAALVSKPLP